MVFPSLSSTSTSVHASPPMINSSRKADEKPAPVMVIWVPPAMLPKRWLMEEMTGTMDTLPCATTPHPNGSTRRLVSPNSVGAVRLAMVPDSTA